MERKAPRLLAWGALEAFKTPARFVQEPPLVQEEDPPDALSELLTRIKLGSREEHGGHCIEWNFSCHEIFGFQRYDHIYTMEY